MGVVIASSSAQEVVKRVSKRKINMDTGNVASYSVLMNGLYQLVHFKQANALAATLGELNIEKVRDKEETAGNKRN